MKLQSRNESVVTVYEAQGENEKQWALIKATDLKEKQQGPFMN